MKKSIILLLALALLSCKKTENKPEETVVQSPSPTPPAATYSWTLVNHDSTKNLARVKFFDSNYGYFFSDNFLLRTKNGGQTFSAFALPANMSILGATLIDSVTLIVSYNYSTYKSNNGGQSWTALQTSSLSSALFDGTFLNSSTGFIGGNNCILKTTDAGSSWQQLNVGNGSFRTVKFTSSNVGWADNGSGVAYRTSDGGNTWATCNTGFTANTKMYFLNDNVAWAYYNDFMTAYKILKQTTDGGASWQTLFTSNSQLFSWTVLAFPDAAKGFAAGWGGYLAATDNAGASWQQLSSPVISQTISDYHFFSDGKGWACGSGGLIMKYN